MMELEESVNSDGFREGYKTGRYSVKRPCSRQEALAILETYVEDKSEEWENAWIRGFERGIAENDDADFGKVTQQSDSE